MPDQTNTDPQSIVDVVLSGSTNNPLPGTIKNEEVPLAFVPPETENFSANFTGQQQQVVPPEMMTNTIPDNTGSKQNKGKGRKVGVLVGILLLMIALGGGMFGYQQYVAYREKLTIASVKDGKDWTTRRAKQEANEGGYKAQINANQAQKEAVYVNNLLEKANKAGTTIDLSTDIIDDAKIGDEDLTSVEKSALQNAQTQLQAIQKKLDDAKKEVSNPGSTGTNLAGTFGWCYNCKDKEGNVVPRMATEEDWKNPNANIAGVYKVDNPSTEGGVQWKPYANADTITAMIVYNDANKGILNTNKLIVDTSDKTKGVQDLELITVQDMLEHPGMTWVPGGVGCVGLTDNPSTAGVNEATVCLDWHWTTCASGGGVNYVGCGVYTKNEKGEEVFVPDSTPVSNTMSCTGITKSPVAPALGNTVTLTCLGSVTPSTAGTLSYKFRYSINGGNFSTLSNTTPTTASLTIAACGTYAVQCQACATLNGVLTCDPVWTGATTN